jgi:hypothetical protein
VCITIHSSYLIRDEQDASPTRGRDPVDMEPRPMTDDERRPIAEPTTPEVVRNG